jgi:hypothetical protein
MSGNSSKTRIDQIRDGALSMQVGHENDGAISSIVCVDDKDMYLVKEHSIYCVLLADEIDPERKNAAVPNANQRVSTSGSSSKIVSRSFLTANALMNVDRFDKSFERKPLIDLALTVMHELLAAEKIQSYYLSAEAVAIESVRPPTGRAFNIPSVDNLPEQVKSYLQKIEHAAQATYQLTQKFYGHKLRMFDGFAEEITTQYGGEDEFSEFAWHLAKLMVFVRNTRHCIEHPKAQQKLVIKNFTLDAMNTLCSPIIEVVHHATPQSEMSLGDFLHMLLDGMLTHFEVLLVHLASKHMVPFGNFDIAVGTIPEEHRRDGTHVQYGYLINMGGGWTRLG